MDMPYFSMVPDKGINFAGSGKKYLAAIDRLKNQPFMAYEYKRGSTLLSLIKTRPITQVTGRKFTVVSGITLGVWQAAKP